MILEGLAYSALLICFAGIFGTNEREIERGETNLLYYNGYYFYILLAWKQYRINFLDSEDEFISIGRYIGKI